MDVIFPVAIIGVILTFVLIGTYVGHVWEQRRTKALAELASELAFDFSPGGDSGHFDSLRSLQLFSQGRHQTWSNHLRGEAGGLAVSIFDYRYTTGHGKHKRTTKQTVICFQFDSPTLPLFSLRPESFWDKVGGWLGSKDINFDTHAKFSSAYFLQGPDEASIRAVFNHNVLDFFEKNSGLSVEAVGNRLLFYTPAVRVEPKKIHDFMARGFEVLKQFRA